MSNAQSDETERAGVHLAGLRITQLGLIFREQSTSDYGIDAHVELRTNGAGNGRLVGLQIKTGPSYFLDRGPNGWRYRPSDRHVRYWLGYAIPAYIIVVDLSKEKFYWQALTVENLRQTEAGNWVIEVPEGNSLELASIEWGRAAHQVARFVEEAYQPNLQVLPPVIAQQIKAIELENPASATWLAGALAGGRAVPDLAVKTLLASAPDWLEALRDQGWKAIAGFAAYHDLHITAGDAFMKASSYSGENVGRLKLLAGLQYINGNVRLARDILTEAQNFSDVAVAAELGQAVCDHDASDSGLIDLAPDLVARLEQLPDDAFILSFFTDQEGRRGNFDLAVSYAERLLAAEPADPSRMVRLGEALCRRSGSSSGVEDDLKRALDLATDALTQLRSWAGPTSGALELVLRILAGRNEWGTVLRYAVRPPRGTAKEDEANREEVLAYAFEAAESVGEHELAQSLLESMADGPSKRFHVVLRDLDEASDDNVRRSRLGDLLDETPEADLQHLSDIILLLATLGVDESSRLQSAADRGLVVAYFVDVVSAVAEAFANPTDKLPRLRVLADEHALAARNLVRLLGRDNDDEGQVLAARAAWSRFSDVGFLVSIFSTVLRSEGPFQARAVADEVLRTPHAPADHHYNAHLFLAELEQSDEVWVAAERNLRAALMIRRDHSAASDRVVWGAAAAALNQAAPQRAHEVLQRFNPEIRDARQARIWLAATQLNGIDVIAASRMLELAVRFEDDVELSAALLTTVVTLTRDATGSEGAADRRQPVSDDLRRQAFDAITNHVQLHGDQSSLRMISMPSPEELVQHIVENLRRDHVVIDDVVMGAKRGNVPLGVVASITRHGYTFCAVQRALGYFVASTRDDSEYEYEVDTVKRSLNDAVVVDVSALVVAGSLGVLDDLRGHFRRINMATDSYSDFLRARVELHGFAASRGTLGWSSTEQRPIMYETDQAQQLAAWRRYDTVERVARNLTIDDDAELTDFPEFDREYNGAWLGPIQSAKRLGLPLWSDDLAQRRVARSVGVPSFGTIALNDYLEELRFDRLGDADDSQISTYLERRALDLRRAIEERVVDVAVEVEVLVEIAEQEEFPVDLAYSTVGRAAWWSWTDRPWHELRALIDRMAGLPATASRWRHAACNGIIDLFSENLIAAGPSLAAVLLTATDGELDPIRLVDEVAAANEIWAEGRVQEHLAQAAAELLSSGLLPRNDSSIEELIGLFRI